MADAGVQKLEFCKYLFCPLKYEKIKKTNLKSMYFSKIAEIFSTAMMAWYATKHQSTIFIWVFIALNGVLP